MKMTMMMKMMTTIMKKIKLIMTMLINIRPVVSVFSIADTPSRMTTMIVRERVRELGYFVRKKRDGNAAGVTRPLFVKERLGSRLGSTRTSDVAVQNYT